MKKYSILCFVIVFAISVFIPESSSRAQTESTGGCIRVVGGVVGVNYSDCKVVSQCEVYTKSGNIPWQQDCYFMVAVTNKDKAICNLLNSDSAKQGCYSRIDSPVIVPTGDKSDKDPIDTNQSDTKEPIAPMEGVKSSIKYVIETDTNKPESKEPIYSTGTKAPIEGVKESTGVVIVTSSEKPYIFSTSTAAVQTGVKNPIVIYGGKISADKMETLIKDSTKIETDNSVKVSNEKIFSGDKEIKIMPDKATDTVLKGETGTKVESIKLITANGSSVDPKYEFDTTKDVKLFGLFRTKMSVKVEVNADNGNIEKTQKPWWSFLSTGY